MLCRENSKEKFYNLVENPGKRKDYSKQELKVRGSPISIVQYDYSFRSWTSLFAMQPTNQPF